MPRKQSVGMIGAGRMGVGVAKRPLTLGLPALVRDIRREAEDEARAAGAIACGSPAAAAQCSTRRFRAGPMGDG